MNAAFSAWDQSGETLESVEARIHDGVPAAQLHLRAQGYVKAMFGLFPWLNVGAHAVEIGPGVGYIMQAFAERTGAAKVTGLDVAQGMIAHARQRLARDGLSSERFDFVHYDGVTFPFESRSIDFFYSVAAIQHVPKPFAYNIFQEITRCLKPTGFAVVQLLSWDHLRSQPEPFSAEIARQIGGADGHWHHFYDYIELDRVFRDGLKVPYFEIHEDGAIWVAWCSDPAALPPGRQRAPEPAPYQALRRELDAMRASTSWRITAPLRAVRRLLAR